MPDTYSPFSLNNFRHYPIGIQNTANNMLGVSPTPDNSLSGGGYSASIGDINSILQGITQKGYFKTSPLTLQMLQNYLQGNEQRAAGQAGSYAGAYAASRGYNPYAFSQHAMGDVYNQYANQFAQLPQMAFQSELQSKEANYNNILNLLRLRLSALDSQTQQEASQGSLGGSIGGLLGAGVGAFGGPFLGALGAKFGKQLGGG